ncbi:MAG TPA: hypothetical protein VLY85_04235 [Thermoplasmata archaeon]|nr:hypothetical protein [Thermoplasmata archaeon]
MRTKPVEGVLRLDVVTLDPRPAVYLAYDGLAGLSQRPMLRDLVEELHRQGPETLRAFIEALRKHHSGQVHVYFADYVSYGIGGGDATSEFFFATFLVLHEPSKNGEPEELQLQRPGAIEHLPLEAAGTA